ncbi:MAG: hypothetical protein EXS32_03845 [Opitutus sp.]|nr:hypothetical protein [Opitutus sp.]
MKIQQKFNGAIAVAALLVGGGCLNSRSSLPVYDSNQIGTVIKSQSGEILSVRDVVIKASSTQAGSTGMGSRIGAAAGRSAIYGGPSAAVGAAGAVIGEAVGAVAGARVDDKKGEEITILVEGGQTVTVVQERGSSPLAPGERVRIITSASSSIYGGGGTKVVRDDEVVAPPIRRP